MKALLVTVALLFLATSAWAQATIHATTTMHNDGTRTVTVVDTEKQSAEETIEVVKTGKVLRKTTYLMDDRGQYMGSITYDPKGTILYRTSYKHDASGRVDEEVVSTADSQLIRRRVYTYGTGNKVTNVAEYDANGNAVTVARKGGTGGPLPPAAAISQDQPLRKRR